MATLGGVVFAHNAIEHDYTLAQTVGCLKDLCDKVVVVDAGSDDGTTELIRSFSDENTTCVYLSKQDWANRHGREKISFYQNLGMSFLTTDYYFSLQADEILTEDSFPVIRKAIEEGKEGFIVRRFNLWGDSQRYLHVGLDRQPCGTHICRLARVGYLSLDDGEAIGVDRPEWHFADDIKIYHYGFVRDKNVMKNKIINMQENVFEVFDWRLWFSDEDLSPVHDPTPKYIQEWAAKRDLINTNQQ
jgi:glycosyltransferase involved in cell wall biosynthesis